MKKFIIVCAIVALLGLSGCSTSHSTCVMANDTMWIMDQVEVNIGGAMLNRSHPYDITNTEDGYDVTFHLLFEE